MSVVSNFFLLSSSPALCVLFLFSLASFLRLASVENFIIIFVLAARPPPASADATCIDEKRHRRKSIYQRKSSESTMLRAGRRERPPLPQHAPSFNEWKPGPVHRNEFVTRFNVGEYILPVAAVEMLNHLLYNGEFDLHFVYSHVADAFHRKRATATATRFFWSRSIYI